ncbi:hypothetical protein [Streptomyces sp. Tue6028]|uniref:hypothetical protein n=1 Tax=Streptomyces sp. Tue6028 TaxID=2036037 RepID=UPI003D7461ED
MVTASQQTEVRIVFRYCRLGRSELDRIFSLAPEGISAANTVVSTQRDSTRYNAGSLADLIDSLQQANASGHLDVWDNLSQYAADAAGERLVNISMDSERVVVQVSGRDATWVHGQAARLVLLLEGAGGRKQDAALTSMNLRRLLIQSVLFATLMISVVAGAYIASPGTFMSQISGDGLKRQIGAFVGMVSWLVLAVISVVIVRRANRALLLPTTDAPQGSWWKRASNADKIALGGLAVAAFGLAIAAVTLGSDLTGDEEQPPSHSKSAPASTHAKFTPASMRGCDQSSPNGHWLWTSGEAGSPT